MSFQKDYYRNLVADWRDYYINYEYLSEELKRIRELAENICRGEGESAVKAAPRAKLVALQKLQKDFAFILQGEIIKFAGFFKLSFNRALRPRIVQLNLNLRHFKLIADPRKRSKAYFAIKRGLLMYYKELHLFLQYITCNVECVETLCSIYKAIFVAAGSYDAAAVARIYVSLGHSFPLRTRPELERMIKTVAGLYADFCQESWEESREDLHAVVIGRSLSVGQLITTGVFIGVFALSCCIVAFLLYEMDFFSSKSGTFVDMSFPVFRGTLIMFLYIVTVGVCVFVWERYNINYRRAFDINEEHMRPYEIFKLGFGFLCLWIITFLYCGFAAISERSSSLHAFFSPTLANWLPLALYLGFLGYLFFPSRRLLHGDMRLYLLHVGSALGFFLTRLFDFKERFALSQFSSFRPFLRDLGYTVCYAQALAHTGQLHKDCAKSDGYLFYEALLTFVPQVMGFAQEVRRFFVLQRPSLSARLFPFVSPALGFLTTLDSYRQGQGLGQKTVFLAMLVANTLLSYYDDVVDSWALLQPKSVHPLLRDTLALPHRGFYYFTLAANLPLRFFWVLGRLPERVFPNRQVRNFFNLFFVFIEILRRTLGNILKVEVQHLKGVGNFNAVQPPTLPFVARLEVVARRPDFEQEYREALYQAELKEQGLAETEAPGVEPYPQLDYSFDEQELKDFAKKRVAQLIKKSDHVAKTLLDLERRQRFASPQLQPMRRRSTHKWNDDLSLNISLFPASTRRSAELQRQNNSLHLPSSMRLGDESPDPEAQPVCRLGRAVPIKPAAGPPPSPRW